MKMNKLLCTSLLLFLGYFSFAQIEIDGNNQRQTLDCKGQKVEVGGSGHVINLKGDCGKIEIMGTNNTVTVNGLISAELAGEGNILYYRKAISKNGKLPQTIEGNNNKIIKKD
ncbi:DUF3060 domain-containing protein [Empedobacter tilapiae]